MRRLFGVAIFLVGCCSTGSGGNGLSAQQAICLCAPNENAGIREEYEWLNEHYPGYHRRTQHLVFDPDKKKVYDILDITTADGTETSVYFDITWYYGKW